MDEEEIKIMARSKKMIFLISVLLIVIAGYFLILKSGKEKEVKTAPLMNISINEINKIYWNYSGEEIEISRNNDKWTWVNDENYPINQVMADDIANTLASAQYESVISDKNPSEYGLDTSQPTVKITLKNGEDKSITIGNVNDILNQCYVKLSGDDNIYLVDISFKGIFEYGIDDLLQTENIPYLSDANEITITKEGSAMTVTSSVDENGTAQWKYNDIILNSDKINEIKLALNSLYWNECVEYNADEAKLAEYGFNTPQAVITWKNKSEAVTLIFGNDTDDKEIYVRLDGSNMIYTVSSNIKEYFINDYNSLI